MKQERRREVWRERSAQDPHARALAQAKSRLQQPNPALTATEIDARVRAGFGATLVPGEVAIPESWRDAQPMLGRARRGRRAALAH